MGALSSHFESDIVWSIRLNLEGGGSEVVEIFVEQLMYIVVSHEIFWKHAQHLKKPTSLDAFAISVNAGTDMI